MTNTSKYQRYYWLPRVAELQHGEYCKGCGFSKDSKWFIRNRTTGKLELRLFTGIRLDKINNDGNHTVTDNEAKDFQILCISCNRIKNPSIQPQDESSLHLTGSERKNRSAEKPLHEWLFRDIKAGKEITYAYFVSEGSFQFDVSPYTIETRYYKKYFKAPSAPFETWLDLTKGIDGTTMIRFKEAFELKQNDFAAGEDLQTVIK